MQECAKFDFDARSTPESSASGSDERQHQPAPQLPPAQSNVVVIDIGLAVDNRNVTHDGERLQLLENTTGISVAPYHAHGSWTT